MELKNALVAAQDSACLQILLEICLPLHEEKVKGVAFSKYLVFYNKHTLSSIVTKGKLIAYLTSYISFKT